MVDAVLDILVGVHSGEVTQAVRTAERSLGVIERVGTSAAALAAVVVAGFVFVTNGAQAALFEAVITGLGLLLAVDSD